MKIDLLFDAEYHPAVLVPSTPHESSAAALHAWLYNEREEVNALLLRHGAVLCRGFGLVDVDAFRQCVSVFGGLSSCDYVGGNSPRTAIGNGIYTSTEYAAEAEISIHNEMSYASHWPHLLFFYCAQPAARGGQTTLVDGRDLLSKLPPELVDRFASRRLRYVRSYHSAGALGRSWQETYGTHDRTIAEARIMAAGSEFNWNPDGDLQVWTYCDAVQVHPRTGERVWFNQAEQWHPSSLPADLRELLTIALGEDAFPHDCRYQDGSRIDEEDLRVIRQTQAQQHLLFDWNRHDLLLVDNMRVMHGRQPFEGERRVLVSMI
ncbi:TauD/TfdA family dioxygenase [Burkholderia cenocepacia]|uniref:TauD/TfdA family dioxygenase n=1 Tax=Burkholderia cenocepacia TaxID=95486 RepID=UPI000F587515|nr:TauD/TfdA family dioxygenase [Burkholderia cenocepacia]RQU33431.1 TauD/TfdA family dioxygenase [Burkholderia cenocepacia]RQU58582.1 TauD/TfdA family dioxygenase [Burkholderia cenocepacia]